MKKKLGEGQKRKKKRGAKQKFIGKMLSAPVATPGGKKLSVLLCASVEKFGVSRMRDFLGPKGERRDVEGLQISSSRVFNILKLF